jgi:hypothetical protein
MLDTLTFIAVLVLVIWKIVEAFSKGYGEEKGKNLARKEDIDTIRAEIKVVTKEAETIRAEISSGVWRHQWELEQKRSILAEVISVINDIETYYLRLTNEELQGLPRTPDVFANVEESARRMGYALAMAQIFLSSEIVAEISHYMGWQNKNSIALPQEKLNRLTLLKSKVCELAKSEICSAGSTVGNDGQIQ